MAPVEVTASMRRTLEPVEDSETVSYTHLVQACGERSGKRIGERRLVLFDDAANGSAKAVPAGSALGEIRTAHERIAQALSLIHI